MKIDLRKCKNGTKLICRDGKECTYMYLSRHHTYPHILMSDGNTISFTDEGYLWGANTPHDWDIVEMR